MYHLLLPEDKKAIARAYKARRIAVGFGLFAAASALTFAAMIPPYIRATGQRSAASAELAAASAKNDPDAEKKLSDEIAAARSEAALLAPSAAATALDALEKAIADKPSDIHLSGFYYSANAPGAIHIAGRADTREALLRFEDTLRAERLFAKVELPISSFASSRNIDFTIDASGSF